LRPRIENLSAKKLIGINVSNGMESFTLPGGLYAVFALKGSDAESLFQYIFKLGCQIRLYSR